MANEVVGIDIKADVRSLRTQIREATQEFVRLQESGSASAQEIAKSAKRVAELKDALADARSTIDAFNPDQKFRAFSQSIQGVTGAFASAQGALALFGKESEDLQRQLLKVQGALALSEGLNQVLDSVQGFKNLALVIKTNVIGAFTTLRGAIVATGIGALTIGLGLLVANFDKVKDAVLRFIPGLAKVGDIITDIFQKITDFTGITSQADRALELYLKNSQARKEAYQNELKILEAQGASEKQIADKRKQIIQEEINALKVKQKNNKELTDEEVKRLRDSRVELQVIDANYRKAISAQQKKANDEYLKNEEEKTQAEIELSLNKIKFINDTFSSEQEKAISNINANMIKGLELFKDNIQMQVMIVTDAQEKIEKEREKARTKYEIKEIDLQKTLIKKRIESDSQLQSRLMKSMDKSIADNKKAEETKLKFTELAENVKLQLIGDTLNNASTLIGKQTAIGKALAIAGATIDTYRSANLALATLPPPFGAITAGVNIATGLKNVYDIIATPVPGSSDASVPAPSIQAPIIPQFTPAQSVRLDNESLNTINNVATRAYVVESDISGSQQRIKRLENSATF